MRQFFFLAALALTLLALPFAAPAQSTSDEDRGYLQALLEDALSGEGRRVHIDGFAGALSSRATIETLTISDETGIWLTARGLSLGWNRAALLTGRLEIAELSAAELNIPRAPIAPSSAADLPSPEARDFALPDLPVSVSIGALRIARAEIGAALLGQNAVLALDGAAELAAGAGQTALTITRAEGGSFRLTGAFSNVTRHLTLDLSVSEPSGGLVASLLALPGTPALDLSVKGDAPLDDFSATLQLSTDGTDRLNGTATLAATRDPNSPASPPGWRFAADLGGDIAPIFAPAYRPFFGPDSRLAVTGTRTPDGLLDISRLHLTASALTLSGSAQFSPEGWPLLLDLGGRLASPTNAPVLLPLSGPETYVTEATLALSFDARQTEDWSFRSDLRGLTREGIRLDSALLTGAGQIAKQSSRVTGQIATALSGLSLPDPALALAIGPTPKAQFNFDWTDGAPLSLFNILAVSNGAALSGRLTASGNLETLSLAPDLSLAAIDLTRFSSLAGLPLTGMARLDVLGSIAPLTGAFDLTLTGSTRDLSLGQPKLDPLLAGEGRLELDLARDRTGTFLRRLETSTAHAAITAQGVIRSQNSALSARAELTDFSRILPELSGPGNVAITVQQNTDGWRVEGKGSGAGGATLSFEALLPSGTKNTQPLSAKARFAADSLVPYARLARTSISGAAILDLTATGDVIAQSGKVSLALQGTNLRVGPPALAALLGQSQNLTAELSLDQRRLTLRSVDLATAELTARLEGETDGTATRLTYQTRLADLSRLAPGFPGAASLSGTATTTEGTTWQIDAKGTGPGGLAGSLGGTASARRFALQASGLAPLALANEAIRPRLLSGIARYDLRLDGPASLSSLSGTITTSDARLALPAERLAFGPIAGTIRLANGSASVALRAPSSTDGALTLNGPVALTAPYQARLTAEIDAIGLSDPTLYRTRLTGAVSLIGPLTNGARLTGALELGNTEIRVPDSSASAYAGLPGLRHVNEAEEVRRTRSFAGLIQSATAPTTAGRAFPVDILLSAPSRIFVRGRGLDAELGGQLRLQGTTADLRPQGRFELIRGRLDVLGQRFNLTNGQLRMQGNFDPWLRFVADTETAGASIRIILEGLASAPGLSFESSPALPEDEVLSLLIFGRETARISPLQAVRLALAVRTLTGRGGEGVTGTLRKGLRLDDLDVRTTDAGTTEARLGAYLSDKLYSEVTTESGGDTEINLNLQIRPGLTARGRVTSAGETGIGIYLEKDY